VSEYSDPNQGEPVIRINQTIIDDVACPACNVPSGTACTEPVPPRVIRACSARTQVFSAEGSVEARRVVDQAISADIAQRYPKLAQATGISPN